MKRNLVWSMLATLALVACGGESPTDPGGGGSGSATMIEVTPASITFGALGSSVTLTGVVKDASGNILTGQTITWTAASPGIVTVEAATGIVTSVANGSITVRGTAGSAQGTVNVTVAQAPASLSIGTPQSTFSIVGAQATIQPVAADSNGNSIAGASFTYASTNPAAVHVSDQGVVTANGPGLAELSVTLGSLSDSRGFQVNIFGPQGNAIVGGEVACSGGLVGPFPCDRIDLVSYLPLAGLGATAAGELNDMWGWEDPSTGIEYALVGRRDGVTFVDLSDPETPRAVGYLPAGAAPTSWRDLKVYQNHAYVVADNSPGHGVQIFDLTRLRGVEAFVTFAEDGRYTGVSSVHNIAINEATGFAYATGSGGGGTTCGGGLHMIDLSSPKSPAFAGCFADPTTGRVGTGYTHDVQCVVYDGPDVAYTGREICVGSNETAISVADVTSKGAPVAVSTASYPDHSYIHQGWFTEDQRYFVQNDETDSGPTRMLVWDMTDLDDPILITEHLGPTVATDHNMYVRGDLLYHSNYHFGIRVLDISNPATPVEAGYFDTHPPNNAWGFDGSWSNYPYFDSGVVAVTSAQEGLFILRIQP